VGDSLDDLLRVSRIDAIIAWKVVSANDRQSSEPFSFSNIPLLTVLE
jgi:hypothetical protein